MSVTLRIDEYLWSDQGHHVCDDEGFAIKCTEDTVVNFASPEIESAAMEVILATRAFEGRNADGTFPE